MARRVVIVGGGTAGTWVANRLARLLEDDLRRGRVVLELLTDSPLHLYQPGLLAVAGNEFPLSHYVRVQAELLHAGVRLRMEQVAQVNVAEQRVYARSGRRYPYDLLVLASGARPEPHARPGSADTLPPRDGDGAADSGQGYDSVHTFYTPGGARRLRQALSRLDRGRLVILVNSPHKCPGAPLEFALMMEDRLRRSGRRDRVEMVYCAPGPLHPWPEVAQWAEAELAQRGVRVSKAVAAERCDPGGADLVVEVPVHRGSGYVRASRLAESDFLAADPGTLQLVLPGGSRVNNVYALGDGVDLPVSKAGVTAHYEAKVVAANVAAWAQGRPTTYQYDGKEVCLVRIGTDRYMTLIKDYEHSARLSGSSSLLTWAKRGLDEVYWAVERGML